jgi:hypothetical protein
VTITSNAKRFQFGCIHHGNESKNWRNVEDVIVPTTPPLSGEPQGGTTITLAIRTLERLQGPLELIPERASESQGTPEGQVQPPASTAPAMIAQGPRKRCRVANNVYGQSVRSVISYGDGEV